jgi:toxin ParE1/3/4
MDDRKHRLIWSADADLDLISIWREGAAKWSTEKADQHLLKIVAAGTRLAQLPLLGRTRDELIAGMRSFAADPHIIFYHTQNTGIEIVRVLHQHMDVERVF